MPSLSEFLETLQRSRLLEQPKVAAVRASLGLRERDDLSAVIRALVEGKHLTKFQAAKILGGKSGPFFLGKYRIMRQLGHGGMGKVYYARHLETRRKVAIKVLPHERAAAERNALARFAREAGMSMRLSHPHIAETLEMGEDAGVHFMVMEYIPGQSLYEMVARGGPLRTPDAARLFDEIASGLGHIHQIGVIHRDIKPSNIMVTPDGTAKLIDLGLAHDTANEVDDLTRPGTVVGTMDYIAPEQASVGQDADERSDIYSLGCTLYFALSRRTPFAGGDLLSKIYRHRMEEPDPLEKVSTGVPQEFGALVRKMMAKDPADRYANATELCHDLLKWTNPALVRSLVGSAAESGQLFRPPPPEIDSAELHAAAEGKSLRSLGTDQPTEAPIPRIIRPVQKPGDEPPRPTPLQRIKPPQAQKTTDEVTDSSAYPAIVAIVGIGVVAIIVLALWSQFGH